MTKKLLALFFASATAITFDARAQTNADKKPELRSQIDSASYAFGMSVAEDLKSRGIKGLNYTVVAKAMEDAFTGRTEMLTLEQRQKVIYEFLTSATKSQHASTIADGKAFLEENKKKPGVKSIPSGLQYEVIKSGTGPKPKATDEVTVHYKGTLLNGKQFDSSYDRNEPLTLSLNQVIKGWTEGVQLMSVGSKYRFFIPYELGYGERGAGEDIPPYSTLIFEIELIRIGK